MKNGSDVAGCRGAAGDDDDDGDDDGDRRWDEADERR